MKKNITIGLSLLALIILIFFVWSMPIQNFVKNITSPEVVYKENISSTIKLNFLSSQNIDIKNNSFLVSLYGHDIWMADNSATLISEKRFQADKIPFVIDFSYPSNPVDLIKQDQKVENVQEAAYYLAINWDNNNDGFPDEKHTSSKGDITFDYDEKKSSHFNIELTDKKTQTIYLKEVE